MKLTDKGKKGINAWKIQIKKMEISLASFKVSSSTVKNIPTNKMFI